MTKRQSAAVMREILLRTRSYRHVEPVIGHDAARQALRADIGAQVLRRLTGRAGQHLGRPTLEAVIGSMPIVDSVSRAFEWLGLPEAADYLPQYEAVAMELESAYETARISKPLAWAVEANTSALLYCLVRTLKPKRVLETGIANGHSSYLLLSALSHNNSGGTLTSVDISRDVGALVPEGLRQNWHRLFLDTDSPSLTYLLDLVEPLRPIDVFLHDGDHRFPGQLLDYATAAAILRPGGLVLSDDVHMTTAWLVAAERNILPERRLIMVDGRKAFGLAH